MIRVLTTILALLLAVPSAAETISVRMMPDSQDFQEGHQLSPENVSIAYAGPPGEAVWRRIGFPILTTLNEMRAHTRLTDTFGRDPIVDRDTEVFFNSNDVQRATLWLRVDPVGQSRADRDGKRGDMDRVYIELSDVADVDPTGGDFWIGRVHIHIPPQANASTDVIAIDTDRDVIAFRWDLGSDRWMDGFAMDVSCALRQGPLPRSNP